MKEDARIFTTGAHSPGEFYGTPLPHDESVRYCKQCGGRLGGYVRGDVHANAAHCTLRIRERGRPVCADQSSKDSPEENGQATLEEITAE